MFCARQGSKFRYLASSRGCLSRLVPLVLRFCQVSVHGTSHTSAYHGSLKSPAGTSVEACFWYETTLFKNCLSCDSNTNNRHSTDTWMKVVLPKSTEIDAIMKLNKFVPLRDYFTNGACFLGWFCAWHPAIKPLCVRFDC